MPSSAQYPEETLGESTLSGSDPAFIDGKLASEGMPCAFHVSSHCIGDAKLAGRSSSSARGEACGTTSVPDSLVSAFARRESVERGAFETFGLSRRATWASSVSRGEVLARRMGGLAGLSCECSTGAARLPLANGFPDSCSSTSWILPSNT